MTDSSAPCKKQRQIPAIMFQSTASNVGKTILGACPRIGILFKIKAFSKNKHSHIVDIASIIFWK